jgi:2-polyprenyl-3-methyl-5-hydroxy-6-metoxy-1,4-benzoquinol methylase
MLLTITSTSPPATDLGFLLHKNPAAVRSVELAFGTAHVFYPEAEPGRCTAALWCEVDPVALVRRGRGGMFPLAAYVNDRPYAASSLLSVALKKVFGTALKGRCDQRPELVGAKLDLTARLPVMPCRGGLELLRRLFEPLGYAVTARPLPLDERFGEWGDSPYFDLTVSARCLLSDLLGHLYVLLPVTDGDKHYWVTEDEIGKLVDGAGEWLAGHPERDLIVGRYLRHQPPLVRAALAQLAAGEMGTAQLRAAAAEEPAAEEPAGEEPAGAGDAAPASARDDAASNDAAPGDAAGQADALDPAASSTALDPAARSTARGQAEAAAGHASLREARAAAVLDVLRESGARRLLDLGCGDGRLLERLRQEQQFERIVGVDASAAALGRAARRLNTDEMSPGQRERIQLLQGALTYRDRRLAGFDAAVLMEVIEHVDPGRLDALAESVLGDAAPGTVVVTTPNAEYNVAYPGLAAGEFRHPDHRFEWDRRQFRAWAEAVAARYGYTVAFRPVGPDDPATGPPTQLAVFRRPAEPAGAAGPGAPR